MAHVVFYEKPGCINNTKQKIWLEAAGHAVDARNILEHPWEPDELRAFVSGDDPAQWFNRTAPIIKSGGLDPDALSESQAIAALVESPILIRRPLMQVNETKLQGFDKGEIDRLIGLSALPGQEDRVAELASVDLTSCPQVSSPRTTEESPSRRGSGTDDQCGLEKTTTLTKP